MFENEEIESVNSDAEPAPSEPSEPTPAPAEGELSKEAKGTEGSPKETNVPFHEHPRWKEVMEERNTYKQSLAQQQAELKTLKQQLEAFSKPKQEPAKDPMYERLKGIDPEFADYLKEVRTQASKATELEQTLQQIREQTFVQTAVSEVKNLHSAHKVSPELASIYEKQLDAMYRTGQIRSVDDVKAAYKSVHEEYSKVLDSIRRSDRESYANAKKSDAKAPASQPKGKTAANSTKFEWSQNPQEQRAQLVKRVAELAKADQDI